MLIHPDFDPYWEFDKNNHFRPKISKTDFFSLTGYVFLSALWKKFPKMYSDDLQELALVRQFSYGQKALYYWSTIDGQITNGGFLQVYYNKYGQYIPTVIKGLKHIGDHETAMLIQKAEDLYKQNIDIIEEIGEGDLFGTDAYDRMDEFSPLEDAYYKINSKTRENLERYIRSHPSEFCVDENGNEIESIYSGECQTYHANGKIKERFQLNQGIIQGEFTSYFENGLLMERIVYSSEVGGGLESFYHSDLLVCPILFIGRPTGEKEAYFENGSIKFRSTVDSQKKLLREESFFENGQLKKLEHKTMKTKIEKIDEHKEWYENGQLKESGTYKDAYKRTGEWSEWYPDGSIKLKCEYREKDFLVHLFCDDRGKQLLKDGTGIYISNNRFGNGHSFIKECNKVEQEYKNYKLHGVCKGYKDGSLVGLKEFSNGKAHGVERSYYKNGKIETEQLFKDGSLVSTRNFRKSDNPKQKINFEFTMKDDWLKERPSDVADRYPVCLNAEEIKSKIQFPQILYLDEYQYRDTDASTSLLLDINEEGEIIKVNFSSAYLTNGDELINVVNEFQFLPAYKNGQPVKSCILVRVRFEIE